VLSNAISFIIPAMICITFHEVSHGFVAYKLGDTTAKDEGRLSFNPIRHIEPIGFLMMIGLGFGWAKPVPVNMNRFKNPKRGMMLTALAGPVSNILLAFIFLMLTDVLYGPLSALESGIGKNILSMIGETAHLSIALAVFNILPVPPLDGSKVLFSLLSDKAYYKLMHYERYSMILLFVLLSSNILRTPLSNITEFIYEHMINMLLYVSTAMNG